jgi:hypothetical protein
MNETAPKPEPWGRGELCSGKQWVLEPDKDCPVCGAQVGDECGRNPEYQERKP